jgi:hypothetical protein
MVIRHILYYLTRHPDAKDTLQGVLQWWLPREPAVWDEKAAQEALDALVAKGWVIQRQLAPTQILYGLNQTKIEEVQAFLHELERREEA